MLSSRSIWSTASAIERASSAADFLASSRTDSYMETRKYSEARKTKIMIGTATIRVYTMAICEEKESRFMR